MHAMCALAGMLTVAASARQLGERCPRRQTLFHAMARGAGAVEASVRRGLWNTRCMVYMAII
jgi:hypothetical protein